MHYSYLPHKCSKVYDIFNIKLNRPLKKCSVILNGIPRDAWICNSAQGNVLFQLTLGNFGLVNLEIIGMDEYDELYGVSGGNNDSYYGNQDIYGDDQDNSQSYDPEKATLYSNQPNKAEGQSQQEKSDSNPTYDQQQQYYGGDSDNTRDAPQQREYDQTHDQDQSNQSVGGQEEHESHPSVASAANQDEG
ncbi:hypothetical protein INT43_003050 [Umbelopsis isabellina]|uniref:Uncharacterized protein n=1 Tax=Mortierella isabellina TaxID=91625 RepID=A0A8H7UFB7_MORIS|nr:hypothetical protein INT43_003050 [Umbelopsis isabellina]